MPNIFCTKKLEKIIGKQNISEVEVNGVLGNWNANVFYVNRRKFIFLTNDRTCYSVIIPNFTKKDLPKFKDIFYHRFFDQLGYDNVTIDLKLINKLGECSLNFMKTNNNRKVIGTMTRFIKDIDYFLFYQDEMQTLQELNHRITNNLVTVFATKKYEMDQPIELMQELINKATEKVYS